MEHEVGVAGEPGVHLRMLVTGVTVEDDVDYLAGRGLGLDRVDEANKLLMPVAPHAAANDLAVKHVESGVQRDGAVALVDMGHGSAAAAFRWQARLGAVERLDLRFLVDADDYAVRWRVDIKADDVPQLGDEIGVALQLELTDPAGLQAVRPPDARHRADADPGRFRHHLGSPMGGLARRIADGQGHRAVARPRCQRRDARVPCLIAQQARDPGSHEPFLPAPHGHFAGARPAHSLTRAEAVRRRQHDPRSPNVILRAVPLRNIASNRARSASLTATMIPSRILAPYWPTEHTFMGILMSGFSSRESGQKRKVRRKC
jgi:hypothetical protein